MKKLLIPVLILLITVLSPWLSVSLYAQDYVPEGISLKSWLNIERERQSLNETGFWIHKLVRSKDSVRAKFYQDQLEALFRGKGSVIIDGSSEEQAANEMVTKSRAILTAVFAEFGEGTEQQKREVQKELEDLKMYYRASNRIVNYVIRKVMPLDEKKANWFLDQRQEISENGKSSGYKLALLLKLEEDIKAEF